MENLLANETCRKIHRKLKLRSSGKEQMKALGKYFETSAVL